MTSIDYTQIAVRMRDELFAIAWQSLTAEMMLIESAYALAHKAHAPQVRKNVFGLGCAS